MHESTTSTSTHRARWAAIGAAVAVSLGAGGLGIVTATSPEGASAYVPISPCRLLDTRADSAVGTPTGALGPDTEITVDGWGGPLGNCTLPTGTTGLELNVTSVDASTLTNLRIYPEGVDTPTASNLNPAPGEPPTPNSVTAPLNAANGQFHVFNRFGTVHIVIDVVGFYTDHDHDDRYYTKAEADVTNADVDARLPIAQAHLNITGGSTDVAVTGTPGLTATYDIASEYIVVTLDGVALEETTHVVHVTPERVNSSSATEDRSATTYFEAGNVRVTVWDASANAPTGNDVHITIWAL